MPPESSRQVDELVTSARNEGWLKGICGGNTRVTVSRKAEKQGFTKAYGYSLKDNKKRKRQTHPYNKTRSNKRRETRGSKDSHATQALTRTNTQ